MATEVWARNIDVELDRMIQRLKNFPLIAFDTEYPGTIYPSYLDSTDEEWYSTMKYNVESTKLIQCGFTLFNAIGEIGGTWEFNFSNFGPSDTRNDGSIEFLVRHGLNLNKIRNEGVDMFAYEFFPKLLAAFSSQKQRCEFVTFQGAYDFAYFMSILNSGKLPPSRAVFVSEIVKLFGEVYDLKVMAGFCEGLGEHLGLSKLAQLLNIPRVGKAHHAGSDSLLTALVFINLHQLHEDSKLAKGMIYGIGKIKLVTSPLPPPSPSLPYQNLLSYPSSNLMFFNGYDPNYDHHPVYVFDRSGVAWLYSKGMYVNHLPLSTFPYQNQTPYPAPAAYPGLLLPSYFNNTPCFATE